MKVSLSKVRDLLGLGYGIPGLDGLDDVVHSNSHLVAIGSLAPAGGIVVAEQDVSPVIHLDGIDLSPEPFGFAGLDGIGEDNLVVGYTTHIAVVSAESLDCLSQGVCGDEITVLGCITDGEGIGDFFNSVVDTILHYFLVTPDVFILFHIKPPQFYRSTE